LSHPTTDEETTSIYLEDTRSNLRSRTDDDEADETQHLVDTDLEDPTYSRTSSPEQEEDGRYPRIMMNNEARLSQMDINVSSDQRPHDTSPLHRPKKNLDGLSSQAGAILVSTRDFSSRHTSRMSPGYSQYIHRPPPISCNWSVDDHFCNI